MKVFCDRDAKPVATVTVHPSAEWTSFPASIHLPAGVYPLYFVYEGTGAMDFVYFEIE